METETTIVYLTPEQCALFILFQKHYDAIGLMFRDGVFEIENGKATLSFDMSGNLKTIKRELYTYA